MRWGIGLVVLAIGFAGCASWRPGRPETLPEACRRGPDEPITEPPPPLVRYEPPLSRELRLRARDGFVCVSYDVDDEGRVVAARVVASEPGDLYDRTMLAAVRKWTYEPGHATEDVRLVYWFLFD